MDQNAKTEVAIIGAGLTGCFLATELARRGYEVTMYERYSEQELIGSATRRTFNLTFRGFGEKVLKQAGLWQELEPFMVNLKGFSTQVGKNTKPIYTPIDQKKAPCYTIQRSQLLKVLLDKARSFSNVAVKFDTVLISADRPAKNILLRNERTKELEQKIFAAVLGTDGVNSMTRSLLQTGQESSHSQEYAQWSYKQVVLTAGWIEKLQLEHDVAHTLSRKDAVVLSHPSPFGHRTAILILPKGENQGFAKLTTARDIEGFISNQFPSLLPALPIITEELLQNPEGYFVTIHTDPWHYQDFMLILGDAAHGFYPFFGQGVSAGLGDCLELMKFLDASAGNFASAFAEFERQRKPHMDALGELSKQGFDIYRRHRQADYGLIYERLLSELHKVFSKSVPAPLHDLISEDPGKTADYQKQHQKLRTAAKWLGLPILAGIATGLVGVWESARDRFGS